MFWRVSKNTTPKRVCEESHQNQYQNRRMPGLEIHSSQNASRSILCRIIALGRSVVRFRVELAMEYW
jgi:hypothetical protein